MSPSPVLVIDGRSEGRAALARIVREAGYTALEAGTGAEALALLSSLHPQLVFLDLDQLETSGVDLARQGKAGWAREEFEALLDFTGPGQRVDPWRRTSGMHKVRQRRGAAVVRELWETRDRIAMDRDVSPGRVLPDAVLVELASVLDVSRRDVDLVAGHSSRDKVAVVRDVPEQEVEARLEAAAAR